VRRQTERGRLAVLLVDDEELVLSALARGLRRRFDVITANTCEDALSRLGVMHFDAVVVDHDLGSRQGGLAVLDHARTHRPRTNRVLISGLPPERFGDACTSGLVQHFVAKPFMVDELIAVLDARGRRHESAPGP
jgi:ActR/RegA family two-component response regulator